MQVVSKLSLEDKGIFKGRGIDEDLSPKDGQLINMGEVDEDPPPWRSQRIAIEEDPPPWRSQRIATVQELESEAHKARGMEHEDQVDADKNHKTCDMEHKYHKATDEDHKAQEAP